MKFKINPFLLAAVTLAAVSSTHAAEWINSASESWNTPGNWTGGVVPNAISAVADFSNVDLTADKTVTVDASGTTTVGTIKFGDISTPSNNWTLTLFSGAGASRTLLMNNNGSAGVFDVLSGAVTVDALKNNSTRTLTFNVGTAGFNKTGAGSLLIANNNQTKLAGSGLVTVGGGSLDFTNTSANTAFVGSYQVNDTATLAFSNGSLGTGTGSITMNGGTLKWNTGNTQDISSRLAVVAGTTATFDTNGNNVAFASGINFSTGGLVKTGAGTLAVGGFTGSGLFRVSEGIVTLQATGGNTNFTGTYQVDSGATLTVGVGANAGNLYKNGDVANQSVVLNGGTLRFNRATSSSQLISAVTGSGTVSVVGGTGGWTQGVGNAVGTTGTIGGATNFILESGTATLSLANTYTGDTTVSGGTLLVTGALGDTTVTVGADGTLGGTGSLDGSLHLAFGAKLHIVDINDWFVVNDGVTFAGVGGSGFGFDDITGWDYENAAVGTYTLLGGAVDMTNVDNVGAADPFDFGNGKKGYFQEGSLQVVIIPEPSTALLFGGMGLFTLLRRRRA